MATGPHTSSIDARFLRVYDELRDLARQRLDRAAPGDTLQATALVHEVWLKLAKADEDLGANDKQHFFATAAQAMRWILVDRARGRLAAKRRHDRVTIELDGLVAAGAAPEWVVALDAALCKLEEIDERKARVVLLRHFAGLSVAETAEILDISAATVKREWSFARAWLLREIAAPR